MGDQVATARPATVTPAKVRRRPLYWLRPRGVVRGRRAMEHNRVYDAGLSDHWVSPPTRAGHAAGAAAHLAVDHPAVAHPAAGHVGTHVVEQAMEHAVAADADRTAAITEPARWWLRQRWRTVAVDCTVVVVAALLGTVVTVGFRPADPLLGLAGASSPGRTLWALAVAAVWLLVLSLTEIWSVAALRSGQATTRLLVRSAIVVFAGFGVLAFFTGSDDLRTFLLLSVPLGLVGLLVARLVLRAHVRRQRSAGTLPGLVLLFGPESGVADRLPGWLEAYWGAATTVHIQDIGSPPDIRRPDGTDLLADRIRAAGADLVVLTEPEQYTPGRIAALAWTAMGVGTDLVVPAPATGGRAAETTAAAVRLVGGDAPRPGVPDFGLLAVDPRPPRTLRAARLVVDWLLAAVAVVVLLPVVMIATLAVAVAEGPPVFVDTERIGRDGMVFRVWSFRCMTSTPGASRDDRRSAAGAVPSLTRIGRLLRRSGVEGIPGLLNVLSGDLALVGPRPASPAVGWQRSSTPWLRPGLTGRWRDPGMDCPPGSDGESLARDLRVLGTVVTRRLAGRTTPG